MRVRIFSLILFVFLIILLSGLAYIQILKNDRYRIMSEENRLKVLPLMAPRGSIFDRNGNALVKDTMCFNLSVIYNRIRDKNALINAVSPVLGISREDTARKIKEAGRQPYSPVCIVSDIGIDKTVHLEEIGGDYPGLLLEVSTKREYLYDKAAANVLGYIGLINRDEFKRLKPYGYKVNDMVGRDGIEKYYDDYLRGTHGGEQIEVDHRGQNVRTLGYKEPVSGRDVYLTIDLELQKFCDSLLQGRKGVIIVMRPDSGEVMALSSAAAYDPNIFVDREKKAMVSAVLKDKNYPLLDRAIAAAYPPGSVFKVIVGIAGLETGVITPETSYECPGFFTLGKRTFHCWKKTGHGEQSLIEALKNSCNVYFWRVGASLGVDNISAYAAKFGVGSKTGIDLPGEIPGFLPTREWKERTMNDQWYKGETLNYSVGQGYLLCTPIQVARFMSVFANGGFLVKPYIAMKVGDVSVGSSEKISLNIPRKDMETVRQGLRKVVNDRRGTGMKAKQEGFIIAGKTGTAQTSKGVDHGWFAGFAPYEKAALTVVVFDEYGGKGGHYAAEIAGRVFGKAKELKLL
ncbi:MAG: penicillin-binding protein 2 [Candidatus Omnitrophota bacterium]